MAVSPFRINGARCAQTLLNVLPQGERAVKRLPLQLDSSEIVQSMVATLRRYLDVAIDLDEYDYFVGSQATDL